MPTDEPFPNVNVNIIRFGDGWRHDRLRFLWDCYAELKRRHFKLHWSPPAERNHVDNLNVLWAEEKKRPERYAIITEHDFLPSFNFFRPLAVLQHRTPAVAARYCTRCPETKKLMVHDYPGAWYLLIDKEWLPDPVFTCGGPHNDPANLLASSLPVGQEVTYLEPIDERPLHWGVSYLTGTHLFFARHLHDSPSKRVAGVSIGDIQSGHDRAVARWVDTSPIAFRNIIKRREKAVALSSDTCASPPVCSSRNLEESGGVA